MQQKKNMETKINRISFCFYFIEKIGLEARVSSQPRPLAISTCCDIAEFF